MKTVGQILKAARQQRNLTVDQLSSLTKIDTRYIEGLENDRYAELPSETFAKGFIRNLSIRLDLNPDELVAIFRRDFKNPVLEPAPKIRHKNIISGVAPQLAPFIIGGLAFIVYLIFQFRAILRPPKLEILKPGENTVLVSPVEVEGHTGLDTVIYINEDLQTKPDDTGRFVARINMPVGESVIQIKAVNRFSREIVKNIPVTVISK